eukprot:6347442-Alexandrium_andersonii.AAC.1
MRELGTSASPDTEVPRCQPSLSKGISMRPRMTRSLAAVGSLLQGVPFRDSSCLCTLKQSAVGCRAE